MRFDHFSTRKLFKNFYNTYIFLHHVHWTIIIAVPCLFIFRDRFKMSSIFNFLFFLLLIFCIISTAAAQLVA